MPQTNPKTPMASLVNESVRATETAVRPGTGPGPDPLPSPTRRRRKSAPMHYHPFSRFLVGCRRRISPGSPRLVDCSADHLKRSPSLQTDLYDKMVKLSEGFDVPDLPTDHPIKRILFLKDHMDDLKFCCEKAIEHYSDGKKLRPESVRIVKANMRVSAPVDYYITFSAREWSGEPHIYETLVKMASPKEESKVVIMRHRQW